MIQCLICFGPKKSALSENNFKDFPKTKLTVIQGSNFEDINFQSFDILLFVWEGKWEELRQILTEVPKITCIWVNEKQFRESEVKNYNSLFPFIPSLDIVESVLDDLIENFEYKIAPIEEEEETDAPTVELEFQRNSVKKAISEIFPKDSFKEILNSQENQVIEKSFEEVFEEEVISDLEIEKTFNNLGESMNVKNDDSLEEFELDEISLDDSGTNEIPEDSNSHENQDSNIVVEFTSSVDNLDLDEENDEDNATVVFDFKKDSELPEPNMKDNDFPSILDEPSEDSITGQTKQLLEHEIDDLPDMPEEDIPPRNEVVSADITENFSLQKEERDEIKKQEDNLKVNLSEILKSNEEYLAHHENELVKYSAMIRNLREDRENLLEKINSLEKENAGLHQKIVHISSERDELKIEVNLSDKRYKDKFESLKYQLNIAEDKKRMLEEKVKELSHGNQYLKQQSRIDVHKVRAREKELENQLELLRADVDVQIENREEKILELKRYIDALEFDMENFKINERKLIDEKKSMEARLNKLMNNLKDLSRFISDTDYESPISKDLVKKIKI